MRGRRAVTPAIFNFGIRWKSVVRWLKCVMQLAVETECARVNWIQPAHGECWWPFRVHARKTTPYQPRNYQQLLARCSTTETTLTYDFPKDCKNSFRWHGPNSKLLHPHASEGCKKHNRSVLFQWCHDLTSAGKLTANIFKTNVDTIL
jgi:hypothetical protein